MTELDEATLAGIRTTSRERKLSTSERIAIYAFAQKGVPIKLIARTFSVTANAIRYITNYEHTAAHENAKQAFEAYGEARVWNEIVTEAQTASINEGMRKLFEGKDLNDRGYRRNARRGPRARRTGTTAETSEDTGNGEDGRGRAA